MITAIFLAAVSFAILAAARPIVRAAGWQWRDAALCAALLPVALFSVWPYVGASAVGAGDSHHYALQIADFITQERAGVRPILVGGSEHQFNGGVHTVRTAPYFTHLAGLLDLATLRRLSAVQLQNLVVVTTAILSAIAAYLSALHASGRRRSVAWSLGAIYVLSPAIYGPLTLMDMFATYMAAPALAIGWFGLVSIVECEDNSIAHLTTAGAIALLWYAHSPIAVWFSLLWAFTLAAECIRPGRLWSTWRSAAGGALLLGAMAAYAWISLATLEIAATPPLGPPFADFSWAHWRVVVLEALKPYAAGQPFALQFGLPLWLLLFAGLAALGWHRRRATVFALPTALVLLLLFPWPFASEQLWRALPSPLIAQMTWPGQRFYPLLAAAAIVFCAAGLRDVKARWFPVAALSIALGWSVWQSSLLHARPGVAVLTPAVHQELFSPKNLKLSRYSYAFFEQLPPTFTHSWADPEFELHLLNSAGEFVTDNAHAALTTAGPGEFTPIVIESLFTLEGGQDYLVEFNFSAPDLRGEVVIQAPGIRRAFTLPSSGEPRAFGAGPDATKTTTISLDKSGEQSISISATYAGVSYRIIPLHRDALPIRLLSNTPLHVTIRPPVAGFLETPRMWIKGYSAKVNGDYAPVQRSPHGLVRVPVPAGEADVELTYTGPLALRSAWYLSLVAFATWPWLTIVFLRRCGR